MQDHVPDRRHGFVGDRVARVTQREAAKSCACDSNEDALDDVNALENRTSMNAEQSG